MASKKKRVQVGDQGWIMGTHTAHPVTVTQVTYNTQIGTKLYVQFESGCVMPVNGYQFLGTRKAVEATMRAHIQYWQEGLKRFKESVKGGGDAK